jgi:hypothetical protein
LKTVLIVGQVFFPYKLKIKRLIGIQTEKVGSEIRKMKNYEIISFKKPRINFDKYKGQYR